MIGVAARALAACSLFGAGAPIATEPAAGTADLARLSSVQVDEGWRVRGIELRDVDGDGAADLVMSTAGPRGARRVEVHLRRKTAPSFVNVPDARIELPLDVIAWAVADVHADPGRELLLFSASSMFAVRLHAPEAERFVRLATIDFLWQYAEHDQAFSWQDGVRDLDGDGLDDVVVPGPGVERVFFQRRGADGKATFEASSLLEVGAAALATTAGPVRREPGRRAAVSRPGGQRSVSIGFGEGGLEVQSEKRIASNLLAIDDSVPAGQFLDWDGDGDRDALFLSGEELLVFRQEPRGVFATEPTFRLTSPVVRDRARQLDVSFEAWSRDLDGDGRADVVFSAGDKRSKDARTQVLVFLQKRADPKGQDAEHPLFGTDGVPSQVLVLAGFARLVELVDVDGDGKLDLVAVALRPDLIDELRSAASEKVDTQLFVFRGNGSGFDKRPALVQTLALPASGADRTISFAGDVSGDGVADFFVRDDPTRLRVLLTRRGKDGTLTTVDRALWELPLDARARIVLPARIGPGSWDLAAWTEEQVTCASFR